MLQIPFGIFRLYIEVGCRRVLNNLEVCVLSVGASSETEHLRQVTICARAIPRETRIGTTLNTAKCASRNTRHGRVVMATFNRERVEHALNELLVRIVPEDPEEDEDQANERYDAAYDHAYRELSTAGDLPIVADINHVASQIDRRCKCRAGIPR